MRLARSTVVRGPSPVALVAASLLVLPGCTTSAPAPSPAPTVTSSEFPALSGVELDRSLRNGSLDGESSLPPFGRLLAATQSGGPTSVDVDLTGTRGSIIGIFTCSGDEGGVRVRVARAEKSVLGFGSEGCDATNIYSGQSQPIGSGPDKASLRVDAPAGVTYALVLEEVAK